MKFFIIGLLIFITGCTILDAGNYCGGFPTEPELRKMQNSKDVDAIMKNTIKSQKYIKFTEKAKKECKYVISY